jgi:hypothetical protein
MKGAEQYYFEAVSISLERRLEVPGAVCLEDVKHELAKIPQYGSNHTYISQPQMAKAFTAIMKCLIEMKRAEKAKQHGHYVILSKKPNSKIVILESHEVRTVMDVAATVKINETERIIMCGEFVGGKLTVGSIQPSFAFKAEYDRLPELTRNEINLLVTREFKGRFL